MICAKQDLDEECPGCLHYEECELIALIAEDDADETYEQY